MRLAFVGPLPPAPTGIGDYDLEVLALLSGAHEIDAFHDQPAVDAVPGVRTRPASELLEAHRAAPYDAIAYQLGNGPAHDFVYPLLEQAPGLLVLHDLVLHHARARIFLESPAVRAYRAEPASEALARGAGAALAAYRAELDRAYPAQAARLFAAQMGTVGRLLPYAYPLFHGPVAASRAVAVHNDFMASAIREEVPGVPVHRIPMAAVRVPVEPDQVAAVRERHGLGPDDVVVGAFGLLTAEKQPETVARAVARAAVHRPHLKLMLVGPVGDARRLLKVLAPLGVGARTVVTGRVDFAELPAYMEACDVVAHLRYPTARETSAALLRLLAQGRPTVMSDLEHLADVPEDAVVRAPLTDEEGTLTRALLRLFDRPGERQALGAAAAAFVAREHSPARCRAGYEAALAG